MFKNKEYVLAIYREGGFSKAAEKLYISQPSLSASVKRIEQRLAAPIFDRTTTPISLTDVGKRYVDYALEIEEREMDLERYISDSSALLTGTLKIGGSSLFSAYVLPPLISAFKRKYPNIELEIFEDNTKNLMQKLSAGYLDVVVDNTVTNTENICSTVYTSEVVLLAVPETYEVNERLAANRLTHEDVVRGRHFFEDVEIDIDNFCEYPFVFLTPENDTGERASHLFRKHGIVPNVIFHLDQQVTAYNISSTGIGISFVSDTLIKHTDSTPPLFYYRLKDEELTRNIYFYQKTNKYVTKACEEFIKSSLAQNA